MTRRSVVLGLLGASLICGVTYFNDAVMRQTFLVGNHMPFSIYGAVIILVLCVNPLIMRASKRLALTGREIAVILALTVSVGCIPSSAMMRILPTCLILPHRFAQTEPAWKKEQVVELAPRQMLADLGEQPDEHLSNFVQGLGTPSRNISLTDIPWSIWTRTLSFWLPLYFSMWLALIALAVVVHRQWADHEHLPYPIAHFSKSLLVRDSIGHSSIFRDRCFWIGLAAVLSVHLLNYLNAWFPDRTFRVVTQFNLSPLARLFPTLQRGGGGGMFSSYCRIYFTAVGVAYLLATDVSLSLGLAPFLFFFTAGVGAKYGFSLARGAYLRASPVRFLMFGAHLGFFMMILYTGRRAYGQILRGMFGLHTKDMVPDHTVWAARVFVFSLGLFCFQLVAVGLDWQIALAYSLLCVMFFLIMGRVIAETGLFFFQPNWYPCVILTGLFGAQALGLETLLIVFLVTTLIVTEGREALMPYVVNSLKLVDSLDIPIGRVAFWTSVALLVGVAVAVPVTLYFQYNQGANMADQWACHVAPRFAFDEVIWLKSRLAGQDRLANAGAATGFSRLLAMEPGWNLIVAALIGMTLVVAFSLCRLRFPRWPLHPVLFLVWHGYSANCFAWSFLLGWLLKVLVTRYGGIGVYNRLKPMVFGVIAGDMLGGFVPLAFGFFYYWFTGEHAPVFSITPG